MNSIGGLTIALSCLLQRDKGAITSSPLTRKTLCSHPLSFLHLLVSPPSQALGFSEREERICFISTSLETAWNGAAEQPLPQEHKLLFLHPREWSRETKPLCSFLCLPSAALPPPSQPSVTFKWPACSGRAASSTPGAASAYFLLFLWNTKVSSPPSAAHTVDGLKCAG